MLYRGLQVNIEKIRKDFPFLSTAASLYFDNAATTQKPQSVIDAISHFYAFSNSNVLRSFYEEAEKATSLYEGARAHVASFIGAASDETIFTSGTTEGINFVASTWGEGHVAEGDEIIVSQMEHHANFLPWQQLAKRKGALLKIIPITSDYQLDLDVYKKLLSSRTKLVAVVHVSNVLGTKNDVETIIKLAHKVGARVLIDAAQSAPHQKLDVHQMDTDFLVFSAHKMLGPTGIGCLFIKRELQPHIPPYKFGGGMVEVVEEDLTWMVSPHKFEAGTPPIAQAIGFNVAISYLEEKIPFDILRKHEASLVARAIEGLRAIEGVHLLGPLDQLKQEGHILSFWIEGIHAHDVAAYLNRDNPAVAVRAGQQCTQPLHRALGLPASIRISFYCYNTVEEVEKFVDKIKKLKQ